jgi:plastocyanin
VRLRPTLAAALCGTTLLAATAVPTALASDKKVEPIRIQDRCDPNTFNPVGVLCTRPAGGENRTFQEMFVPPAGFIFQRPAQILKERDARGWRFNPDDLDAKPGTTLHVVNEGGEVHSFTNVTNTGFTLGCVPPVNAAFAGLLPAAPAALCAGFPDHPNPALQLLAPNGAPPPVSALPNWIDVPVTGSGTLKYQCMIHPWMRTTVEVKSH